MIEAWGMAVILLVSGLVTALIEPRFHDSLSGVTRRGIEGVAIAGTVVALVYSTWGRRSGAHFNPAVTLTFLTLGKVRPLDALLYGAFQSLGAIIGIGAADFIAGVALETPPVRWIVTQPGPYGAVVAFVAEFAVAFALMSTVLWSGSKPRLSKWTGALAGAVVFACICLEAPLSGFSMNPSRTFASALGAHSWTGFWIYLVAPPLGMLTAAWGRKLAGARMMACAKLVHDRSMPCIHCGYQPGGTTHV